MTEKFNADAVTMTALINALGAVTFAIVRHLPAGEREGFASDLARLAALAEREGRQAEETVLLDIYAAARKAAE